MTGLPCESMPGMLIDPTTARGAHAARRLRSDPVIWLTTVSAQGQPQSTPVWFIWEEGRGTILIFSIPTSPKLANVRANPKVSLHFNDIAGSDVVTIEGVAEIAHDAPPIDRLPEYVEKYRSLIVEELGSEPEPFARQYSQAIRVTPTRVRALWPVEEGSP
jgi:PPOX class probable F420-dependent enzyme